MLRRLPGYVGTARLFWEALREISPADVEVELHRPFRIALYRRPGDGREALTLALFGSVESVLPPVVTVMDTTGHDAENDGRADLSVLALDAREPDWAAERRLAHTISRRGTPLVLLVSHAGELPTLDQARRAAAVHFPDHPPELLVVSDGASHDRLRARVATIIARSVPRLRLAIGYRLPALRGPISEDLIREASRMNAQFALVSSLPSLIPLVGSIFGNVADLIVLTKNQALLVFKLAGLYERDLSDRLGVAKEILPVVGGGFAWRTLARSVVGLAPAYVSALPKASVAYVGTYVVGATARFYYDRGRRPAADELREIGRWAVENALKMREVVRPAIL